MRPYRRRLVILLWLVCQLVLFSVALPASVSADDCLTDPLNAADCMRTPGFRPVISVIISVGGTIATILVNVLSSAAASTPAAGPAIIPGAVAPGGPAPDAPPPEPADAPGSSGPSPGVPGIIAGNPQLNGGPVDNPFTQFTGGDGPARCSTGGLPNYWVNTANLNLYVEDVVYRYRGLGPEVVLSLSYNSVPGGAGLFGSRWRFAYESTIERAGDRILVWRGSGQRLSFRAAGPPTVQPLSTPAEAVPLEGGRTRLFDYGSFYLLAEPETALRYRYEKSPDGNRGRLIAIFDRNDNAVRLAYNPDGTLRAVIDAAGRETSFSYDHAQRCTGFALPDGRRTQYAYDGRGNLIRAVDLLATEVRYDYDDDSSLVRITVDRDQKTTTFAYQTGTYGKVLASVTDAAGNSTRYEVLSVEPRQTRRRDPEGQPTTYESTPQGATARVEDALGNAVSTQYADGLPVAFTDARGQTAQVAYDAYRRMVRMVDPLGATWASAYDDYDHLTSETGPSGDTWRYEYDNRGNMTRAISPEGRAQTLAYDEKGQLIAIADGLNNQVRFAFDAFGNVISRTEPTGALTRMQYDAAGLHMVALTDPRGNTTRFDYDANDRLTGVTYPDGASRRFDYDCCAGISEVDESGARTILRRDALLQLGELTDAVGGKTLYAYTPTGRLAKRVDALGRTTTFGYDAVGRRVREVSPLGTATEARYDPNGNLVALVNALGKATTFDYDAAGHRVRTTDALGQQVLALRWEADRLAELVTARGQRIGLRHSPDGHLIAKSYDGAPVAGFQYDAAGNLVRIEDAMGVQTFAYDALGQTVAIRYPDNAQVTFAYDATRNLSRVVYPTGVQVEYSYDQRDRLVRMAWQGHSIEYGYDAAGRRVRARFSNGVQSNYGYDQNGGLTRLSHSRGGQAFVQLGYTRNAIGDLTAESGSQPVAAAPPSLRLTTTYNELDQIVAHGQERYVYDADGNLTAIGARWQARYDAENRMVSATRDGRVTTYQYNALGQRVRTVTGGAARSYHYDLEGRLLFETDARGQVTQTYLYADGLLAASITTDGQTRFYHFDHQGSTLATTNAAGEITAAYGYTPFGIVASRRGAATANPFTFAGAYGVVDEGDGLYGMQQRVYDAHTGRFLQKDPLGTLDDMNLYSYVHNNPRNWIDPWGLATLAPGQTPQPVSSGGWRSWLPGWGPTTAAANTTLGVYLTVNAGMTLATGGTWPAMLMAGTGLVLGASRVYSTVKRAYNGEYGNDYHASDAPVDLVDPTKFGRKTTSWLGQKWEDFKSWGAEKMWTVESGIKSCYRVPF